jgi:hypothetical protein
VGLKLNGSYQLPADADNVNLWGDNIDIINKSTKTFIDISTRVGLEVNVEETKCMLVSLRQNASHIWDQNAGQNRNIKIATDGVNMCHSPNIWK